jgi:hypothetical protein
MNKRNHDNRQQEREAEQSPTVTPYDNALNNAEGSMADREGNNSGRNNSGRFGNCRGGAE